MTATPSVPGTSLWNDVTAFEDTCSRCKSKAKVVNIVISRGKGFKKVCRKCIGLVATNAYAMEFRKQKPKKKKGKAMWRQVPGSYGSSSS